MIINCLCSFVSLPAAAPSVIGPFVGGVVGGFIFIVVIICCIAAVVIKKHHKSRIQTSYRQQIELRSAGTIQPNTASHPLAQQPPPSYPQRPPPSYSEQPPAAYLVTPLSNTVYLDQEINMEPKTLRVHPPPSYADLYNN